MRILALVSAAALFAVFSVTAVDAGAFCRLTTCKEAVGGPECQTNTRGCITEGEALFYAPACLSFAVARGDAKALGLSDDEFLDTVTEAFDRWSSVDCGGGKSPGFKFAPAGIVDSEKRFFCEANPELNMSVWSLNRTWAYDSTTLGFTTSTFEIDQGEVFDADVELNLGKIVNGSFPLEAMRAVLLSIATHEAGHVLGLAHSDDPEAVMAASYDAHALLERALTADDVAGICEAFPPGAAPDACSVPGVSEAALDPVACEESALPPDESSSCSVLPGARPGPTLSGGPFHGLLAMLAFFGLARSRRKRQLK